MSEDYEIRLYQLEDEEQIVSLLDEVFNGWPKFDLPCSPVEHWKWKYLEFGERYPVAVCLKDGEIIACDHEQFHWIKIGKNLHLASNGADSAVHVEHRRRGLFTKMNAIKDKVLKTMNIGITYAVTSNPILIKREKKLQREHIPSPLKNYLLILDIDKYFAGKKIDSYPWIKKQGYGILQKANKARYATNQRMPEYNIRELKRFDRKINVFWEKLAESSSFIIRRDQDYLNWRYCDPRGGEYMVRLVEHNGEVLGYSVLRINKNESERMFIVDLTVLPGRNDVREALTHDAIMLCEGSNVNGISTWIVAGHPCDDVFRGNGFVDIRNNPHLYFQVFNPEIQLSKLGESRPEQIHFQMGDSDWI